MRRSQKPLLTTAFMTGPPASSSSGPKSRPRRARAPSIGRREGVTASTETISGAPSSVSVIVLAAYAPSAENAVASSVKAT